MKYIGAHVSAAGGVENAPLNAQRIGANAFALFTKNQKQWAAPPLTAEHVLTFQANLAATGILPRHVLPHDSYLINVGHPEPELWEKSTRALREELERVEALGLDLLNFHPGTSLGVGSDDECLARIATAIDRIHAETARATLVLENTAGQGSAVGWRFEQLAGIVGRVKDRSRVGVCLDTCHLFAAGYDLRSREAYEATMAEFDRLIGFSFLRGVHLNDAKVPFASRKDRHDCIGRGTIGLDAFSFLMNDPRFDDVPLVLETIDESRWPEEIALLRGMMA